MTKNKYVNHVLMCKPSHFQVEYEINPWMKPGSVDSKQAMDQWEQLVETLERQDIMVSVIDQQPDLPDMVFSTDIGISNNDRFLLGNFKHPQRQGEIQAFLPWLTGNLTVDQSDSDYSLEGGDVVWFRDRVLVGTGFRTDKAVAKMITKMWNIEALTLELTDAYFYHLDTCLLVLNDRTVFYYPLAFSKASQQLLQRLIPSLIPLSLQDVQGFAGNSLVTDHHVIMPNRVPGFKEQVKQLGYKPVEVEVGEFLKAGGGIHCLSLVLQTEYR